MKEGFSNFKQKKETEEKSQSRKGLMNAVKGMSAAIALGAMPHGDAHTSDPKVSHTYEERTAAAAQLKERGVTDAQHIAYKEGLSEDLARGVKPYGYTVPGLSAIDGVISAGVGLIADVNTGDTDLHLVSEDRFEKLTPIQKHEMQKINHKLNEQRVDAWRMYLGLPQEHHTFGISDYKPEHSTDDTYYYKLNDFVKDFASQLVAEPEYKDKNPIDIMLKAVEMYGVQGKVNEAHLEDRTSGVMGHYTLAKGHDNRGEYISYYDRWDLKGTIEGKEGFVGKPFEIYDRVYYDPATHQIVQPKAE